MSLAIVDNKKHWKQLKEVIKNLKKIVIKVGIQKDAGENSDGKYIADYGAFNEFGVNKPEKKIKIPERSFLRSTTDENDGWKKEIEEAYVDILEGKMDTFKAMSRVGVKARDDIITKIDKGDPNWPPNAPATIKRKKSSRPLIDKAFLKKAIQYQFEVK